MIEIRRGDILEDDADALVNTVNTVGYMGKGLALEIKKRYPEAFREYAEAADKGEVRIGEMLVHERPAAQLELGDLGGGSRPRFIINFPTKRHWRGRSRREDVEAGLPELRRVIEQLELDSVAVPALGCGLGGLEWEEIRPLIVTHLNGLSAQVRLYEP
jgi:O-acetyl-ADP-ribose deacetylase (regulator of RNase III)